MLPIKSLVENRTIPDSMPLTTKRNMREMKRRYGLLHKAGVKPWLCIWGVPGPDESTITVTAESNRYIDRRSEPRNLLSPRHYSSGHQAKRRCEA
jgi:hypothetical protein